MNKVDIHIITAKGNSTKQQLAIPNLVGANIHQIATSGDARQDRFNGYAFGDAPFLCYINEEDYLSTGTLDRLVQALEQPKNRGAVAAYSSYVYAEETGAKIAKRATTWSLSQAIHEPNYPGGLILYRREPLVECAHWLLDDDNYHDWLLSACVAMQGDFVPVPNAVLYTKSKGLGNTEAAKKAITDVAYSCTACRKRLGMDEPTRLSTQARQEEQQSVTTLTTRRSCCGH